MEPAPVIASASDKDDDNCTYNYIGTRLCGFDLASVLQRDEEGRQIYTITECAECNDRSLWLRCILSEDYKGPVPNYKKLIYNGPKRSEDARLKLAGIALEFLAIDETSHPQTRQEARMYQYSLAGMKWEDVEDVEDNGRLARLVGYGMNYLIYDPSGTKAIIIESLKIWYKRQADREDAEEVAEDAAEAAAAASAGAVLDA